MTTAIPGPRIAAVAEEFGTPVWIYDAEIIRAQIAKLRQFDTVRFAQKACSNTHLLRLMREQGVAVDSVSLGEIERALRAGYRPDGADEPIVFTADLLDRATLARVVELGIPVNAGSPQMLEQLGEAAPGHPVWIRINPGFGHGHSRKTNTGGEQSKHGIWHEHLASALDLVDRYRLDLTGFHMHIGSGVDYGHLEAVCETMLKQVRISGHDIRAISAGGGLSVPYAAGQPEVDTDRYFRIWDAARRELAGELGHPVRLEIEPGRFLVANSGVLASEVRAQKPVGSNHFVLVDAGFNDLMRPAMYGSAHRVTVLRDGTEVAAPLIDTVLAGPLCESGDVFTQAPGGDVLPVPLPRVEIGDLAVFHDTGAYGASMSSTYNTRPLIPEVLVDGPETRLIRRRQTVEDLLALED
ncbi:MULTISPECIES: diaminopimelate decarboxylase [unclassified Kitasatospora]|uniref:diaminopimelate decarboxylase n=1 Tax=unclassified Kitasatospora TaxID=2633591 RepID=UPI00070D86E6|nr:MULTISPECIES: diaminopimelate decarboxylase [unclassified Kitasatospora]KQV18619.1 diaminopimelate decarboxylase [Kitasatospora sp. Root107]KRB74601.1 diaminopimelate decarboxylase [Kitasatospora sp. Root187]